MHSHTYDSLRELAIQAVTSPSLEAAVAMKILHDALVECGVYRPLALMMKADGAWHERAHSERVDMEWVHRWAMTAAYCARISFGGYGIYNTSEKKWSKRTLLSRWTHYYLVDYKSWHPQQPTNMARDHRGWSTRRLEASRKGVRFDYGRDCEIPEGVVWPPPKTKKKKFHPHPSRGETTT